MNSFENEAEKLKTALAEFQTAARFRPDDLIVFGCSSSEIAGLRIGSATNMEAARALLPVMQEWGERNGLYLAVQCCEHLNRSLVVEAGCAGAYDLEEVNVIPHEKGGGALAAAAMELFTEPLVVESLLHKAHGGVDIGNTFIGMHLRRVAVCVRLDISRIGEATINCVRTRPVLIGGDRAKHKQL